MDGFSFPLVFGAGVLSFLSPCVLPLVPPYLTYMSGSSFDQLRADGATAGVIWQKSVFTSVFFILGFSLVFVTFGATATAFGQAFRQALPIITPILLIAPPSTPPAPQGTTTLIVLALSNVGGG